MIKLVDSLRLPAPFENKESETINYQAGIVEMYTAALARDASQTNNGSELKGTSKNHLSRGMMPVPQP